MSTPCTGSLREKLATTSKPWKSAKVRKGVRENVLCVFNATPLEKYENYRLCLDRWGRSDNDHSAPDLGPTLYNLIDGMVRFLGINQYSPHNTTQPRLLVDLMPEVYSRSSDALLRRLLSRKGFTAKNADPCSARSASAAASTSRRSTPFTCASFT
jgi:hypothetical protein